MNYDLLWSKVLELVKTKVNSLVYSTWFEVTKLHKIDGNEVTIIAPSDIHRNRLLNVYLGEITSSLFEVTNQNYEINIILEDELTNNSTLSTENVDNNEEKQKQLCCHKLKSSFLFCVYMDHNHFHWNQ